MEGGDTGTPDESQESSSTPFTCDADHPALCDAQEICEEMGFYWYNNVCDIEIESPLTPTYQEEDPEVPAPIAD